MAQMDMENHFYMIVEMVCSNAGYQRMVTEEMLRDYQSYFDICHNIFGQLRIKLVKIEKNNDITDGEKLQQLINLLKQQLELDTTDLQLDISGYEIVQGNMEHIYRLIQILFLYSNIYLENKMVKKVRSQEEQNNRLRENQRHPFKSARVQRKSEENQQKQVNSHYLQPNKAYLPPKPTGSQNQNNVHYYQPSNNQYQRSSNHSQLPNKQNHSQYQHSKNQNINPNIESSHHSGNNKSYTKQKQKTNKPKYSKQSKRARSQHQERKNVFVQVANTIMKQKGKMLQAATRDRRKGRLSQIKQAKSGYKIYLTRYAKENRAEQNRAAKLKGKTKAKQVSQQLDIKDFEKVDNFFDSFAYQLRDKKAAYLRNIQKMVHKQQLQRYYFQNRLQRQLKKSTNDGLEQQLKRELNQHKIRAQLIKQQSKQLQNKTSSFQKELKVHNSKGKKEIKESKMKELKKIQSILKEDNERKMMIFEDGGRLEQIITQMYKRF